MGIFDVPGEFDESSGWYFLRDRDSRALDQAVKARRVADMAAVRASAPVPTKDPVVDRKIEQLQDAVLALGLYARTMLSLLHDKGVIDADEFSDRIRQIDLLDGKLDKR
jgi:hypothetical protein